MLRKQPHDSRRLLVLFILTTFVPAASLAWLGWRMVEQDRLLERQRVRERRDQAADLAAAALQRVLAEAEEKLTAFSAASAGRSSDIREGEALLMFTPGGLIARAATPLPYYPAVSPVAPAISAQLTDADDLELHKRDFAATLRILGRQTC